MIQNCAGLWLEAISEDFSAAPGDSIKIDFEAVNRSDINLRINNVEIRGLEINIPVNKELHYNDPLEFSKTLIIPANSNFTKPFWLNEKPANNLFTIRDQSKRDLGENRENLTTKFIIEIDGIKLELPVPIMHRWVDRVSGENYRYFEIMPPVTANFSDGVYVFPNNAPKRIEVEIKSFKSNLKGTFRLSLPENWKAEPEFSEFQISEKYEVIKKYFTITPPNAPEEGIIKGIVETETGEEYSFDYSLIEHAHIPKISYLKESESKLVRFNTGQVAKNVGYIEGSGDEIPIALSQLGYNIVNLDPETLSSEELSKLDAVILGVRALNTNKGIGIQKEKLMDYISDGGTLIVQYNVSFGLTAENFGPYPYKIGRGRVTIENAPMKCLDEENSLMKFPNKLTDIDFQNWIQERGLYFAETWDNKYHPLFSCSDPGEEELLGSLIYTKFGKGVFIYTGLSFFRQLPAGVSGAYRLFVNLISAGMYNGS